MGVCCVSLWDAQCRLMGLDMTCDCYTCASLWQEQRGPICLNPAHRSSAARKYRTDQIFFFCLLLCDWLYHLASDSQAQLQPRYTRMFSDYYVSEVRYQSALTDGFLISQMLTCLSDNLSPLVDANPLSHGSHWGLHLYTRGLYKVNVMKSVQSGTFSILTLSLPFFLWRGCGIFFFYNNVNVPLVAMHAFTIRRGDVLQIPSSSFPYLCSSLPIILAQAVVCLICP